jgi:diguanylate cyclase
MNYPDSIEKAGELLRSALTYMGKYEIPVNPSNYAVWYGYVSKRNPQLNQAIDDLIKQNKPITTKLNTKLYRDYIADNIRMKNEKTIEEIREVLTSLLKYIVSKSSEMSSHNSTIESYVDQILDDTNIDGLKKIVDGIVAETRSMAETGNVLKERLVSSLSEVETLRIELDRVTEKATTDALTGLANRMSFEGELKSIVAQAQNSNEDLSLLFADLDHFKRVNDTYGHLVGDMVLRLTASMIKGFIKGRDFPARYGGEEFVILLPDTPLKGAVSVAEKIRAFFEKKSWMKKDSGQPIGLITLSFGAAKYKSGESLEAFVKRADDALYLSKRNGRNRVSSEEELDA